MLHWDVIMHVEDDQNYSALLKFALKQAGFGHRLIQFEYANEARAYLEGKGQYADREKFPLPGLAIVDIKLPGINGLDLVRWIRRDSGQKYLPVVVLTSSDDLKDIGEAYRAGVNSFVVKPPAMPQLIELLKSMEGFWIRHNIVSDAA